MSIEDIKDRMKDRGANYLFSCPQEWEELVIKLDQDIAKIDPGYKVQQVKEKFGGLRYYYGTSPNLTQYQKDAIRDLVWWAETESFDLLDWRNDE